MKKTSELKEDAAKYLLFPVRQVSVRNTHTGIDNLTSYAQRYIDCRANIIDSFKSEPDRAQFSKTFSSGVTNVFHWVLLSLYIICQYKRYVVLRSRMKHYYRNKLRQLSFESICMPLRICKYCVVRSNMNNVHIL